MASFENENQNFFAGFQEWDWLKVTYIIFHVLLTFIVPTLLYSICWYERYSPDLQYRMLSNILLSHTCWIGIFRSFFARIPAVLFFTSGPFPIAVCDSFSIFAKYLFVIFFTELTIWQFVRFICIAKGFRMRINEDDLMAFYLTLANIILSIVVIVVGETLSFRISEIDYHLCTGVDPNESIMKLNQMLWHNTTTHVPRLGKLMLADPVVKLFQIESILIFFFAAVSYCMTNKDKIKKKFGCCIKTTNENAEQCVIGTNHLMALGSANGDGDGNFIVGAGTCFAGFVIATIFVIPEGMHKTLKNVPAEINSGSGRMWLYLSRLTIPILSYCLFPIIILWNNSKMRKSIFKELKNFLKL